MYFQPKKIIGKQIRNVSLNNEKDIITFTFLDGNNQQYGVAGDCCSHSWIEHLEIPNDIKGATILSVDDSNSVDETENDALNPVIQHNKDWSSREHESLLVYNTKFHTDKGDIVLEYRNSSNGYYGGYIVEI